MHTSTPQDTHSLSTGPARAAATAELMKNYADAAVVSADARFVAAQDRDGEPLLFSVSRDGRLFVIHRAAGSTGFALTDLSSSLGADREVAAFEVSQARAGAITLALAVRPRGGGACQVYVTPPLPAEASAAAWTAAAARWAERPGPADACDVTAILMGTADDGQGAPMTVVAVRGARESTHYRVNADLADTSWVWSELRLPENAGEILDMALGTVQGDRGVFALYTLGGALTLTFTSLPDPEYGKIARYDFKVPGRATCIAAVPRADDGQSDLYAAGDGVYLFERAGSEPTHVADLAGVSRLLVRGDRDHVALWAIAGDRLFYTGAPRDDLRAWSTPTPLVRGARRIDALRNDPRATNALFVVKANDELEYHWQEPDSGTWSAAPVGLPTTGEVIEFNSYTCRIDLTGDKGPLTGASVEVSASEWVQVAIQGEVHVIDPERAAVVRADADGRITLIYRASSLSSPIFRVRAPDRGLDVRVDPKDRLNAALAEIRSGDDLLRLETRDGRSLADGKDARTRDAAAESIQRLVGLSAELSSGPRERRLLAAAPADDTWGVVFAADVAHAVHGLDAVKALAPAGDQGHAGLLRAAAPSALLVDAGNFLKGLLEGAQEAAGCFFRKVGEVVTMVVKVGEQLFQLAITALGHVYQALHWLLEKTLGVDLDKLVEALGFIFEWDDIVVTHDVLCNLVTETLARGEDELARFEGRIDDFFTDLKQRVRALDRLEVAGLDADAPARGLADERREHGPADAKVDAFLTGPAGSFSSYHLLNARGGAAPPALPDSDPLHALIADLGEVWRTIEGAIGQLGKDVADGLLNGGVSLNRLLRMVATDAVVGLLDVVRVVAMKLVGLGRRLVAVTRGMLTHELEIPVISGLHRRFVGGEFTVLSAVSLLIAAPVTILHKLLTGEAPFPRADPKPLLRAAAADTTNELSSHPRHADVAKKPRTYGLDTAKGAGLWTLITFVAAPAVGGAGYGLFKLLERLPRLNELICTPLSNTVQRAVSFVSQLDWLITPLTVVLKGVLWVGRGIGLAIAAAQGATAAEITLRGARWGVGGFSVIAAVITAVDKTGTAGPTLRAITGVVDLVLAIPYGVLRIVAHANGGGADLIWIDALELTVSVVDCAGTVCSSASSLSPEGTTKAVLWGLSMAVTVWSSGMTAIMTLGPILLERLHGE